MAPVLSDGIWLEAAALSPAACSICVAIPARFFSHNALLFHISSSIVELTRHRSEPGRKSAQLHGTEPSYHQPYRIEQRLGK